MSSLVASATPPPDLSSSLMYFPAALPKTIRSRRELPPNLFAPCTETHAASPTENNPGIRKSMSLSLPNACP